MLGKRTVSMGTNSMSKTHTTGAEPGTAKLVIERTQPPDTGGINVKEPWTIQRFIEILKRHDCGPPVIAEPSLTGCYIHGWIDTDRLVEELNERERQ